MADPWEEDVHQEIDNQVDEMQVEGVTQEDVTGEKATPPDSASPPGFGHRSRGTGKVEFEGDVEREQTRRLAHQIVKSTLRQMEAVDPANRQIRNVRWIETEGSRHIDDPDKFCVTEFEITLASGRRVLLTGPLINVEFKDA